MRWWTELVADWSDAVPLPLTLLLLIVLAALTGLLWYGWPTWWHALRRIRLPRWKRREKTRKPKVKKARPEPVTEEQLDEVEASQEELPAVSPQVFASLADRLAAQGRYAEAVRERLRSMVKELVDRGVVTHHPDWTVTELATHAGAARPEVAAPLSSATEIFSGIWYAKRPAQQAHDTEMRQLAGQMRDVLGGGSR